jgi:hypothetical protein
MSALQKQYNYELFTRNYPETFIPKPTPRKRNLRLVYRAPQKDEFDDDDIVETDHDETLEGMQVSEEDYWEKYYTDTPYEWNNGILEVKPLSDFRSYLLEIFFNELISEFRNLDINFQQIGREIGFKMILNKGKKIRKPDIGFVGPDSLQMEETDCTYKGIFDLCVEFLSDSRPYEVKRDIKEKFKEYEEAGVKEYFILDRNETHTAFFRLKNGFYRPIDISDGIVRSEVLKGFQFRVEHLYSRPDLKELINDPVYKHYVKIDYQNEIRRKNRAKKKAEQEKIRADQEKTRAEQEKERADKEKERAEKYKQKLIDLGVSI